MYDKDAARRAFFSRFDEVTNPQTALEKAVARYQKQYKKEEQKRLAQEVEREWKAKERAARLKTIEELLRQGMNYRQVGHTFGVSRERVRQIVKASGIPAELRAKSHVPKVEFVCRCGKVLMIYASRADVQRWCSRDCPAKPRLTPEEKRQRLLAYNRARYRDPEVKKRHNALTIRYYHKVKHTEAYKAQQRRYTREYQARLRADPVRHAAYKKKTNEYLRKRHQEKKEHVRQQLIKYGLIPPDTK